MTSIAVTNTLESKHYVASEADIAKLTRMLSTSSTTLSFGRNCYLKALVATTQHMLSNGKAVRVSAHGTKLKDDEIKAQLAVLMATHDRFYAVVTETAAEAIGANVPDRGIEINRQTNFARTALSTARRYVKTGNSLLGLEIKQVSKTSMQVDRPHSEPSIERLLNQSAKLTQAVNDALTAIAAIDSEMAVTQAEEVIAAVNAKLVSLQPSRRAVRSSARQSILSNTIRPHVHS